ncbi:MAG: MerR family transcriptional regulator [Chitinophagaceae bacterium]|nr:MerR family transcriptional regulator [Chitinophagaceae bacterium]
MNAFTIKDLENISGIKAHTIRMWEQRYGFLKPQRTETNIRHYCNEELKTILNIALLNKNGYKISQIDKMCQDEICSKILGLQASEAIHERVVNELIKDMVDLKIQEFEQTLGHYINEHGLEDAVREIIFPFLEKIGILWQTGHIMPAQEHFVTSIIRQKLIVAIDQVPVSRDSETCILFLPEGEHHELGLLFLHYLLKSQGKKVVYLGANVPTRDVHSIVDTLKPDMAFIHLTGTCPNFSFDKLLRFLQEKIPGLVTIISGYPTQCYHKEIPPSVQLKRSFPEMMEFISKL